MKPNPPPHPALLSLGSINADFQFGVARPIEDAETMRATRFDRFSGGKAANIALLARRLGHPARLLGAVGRDDLAEQALAPLSAAGVDLAHVRRVDGGTAVSAILVPPQGRKHIVLAQEANVRIGADDRRHLVAAIADAPPGSVLAVDFELCADTARAAIVAARERGLRVVVDPSFPDQVGADDLRGVDAITPNEDEARALAGSRHDADPADVARALASRGARVVCVKLADGGCVLLEEGRIERIAARRVDTLDATGAGDAFTGAFAVALLEGRTAREAAERGVAASTLAVMAWGSQPSYPDAAALEAEWRRLPRCPA